MSPVLVSRGMLTEIRVLFGAALTYTYTRVPTVQPIDPETDLPAVDDWGLAVSQPGVPVAGQPCMLQSADQAQDTDSGPLVVRRTLLWARHDDPIKVGDQVQDVTDQDGRVLLDWATVRTVAASPDTPAAATVLCELAVAESSPVPPPGGP